MHIALFTARHAQTLVSVIPCIHSYTTRMIGTHAKRAENKWKTKMPDIGLGQVDLPRGGMCLQGCECTSPEGTFQLPSHTGCKNCRCYLHVHPTSRKEENATPFSPRAVSH